MKKKIIEGKTLGILEGYNSFMYKDSKRRNEGIVARKTTIQNEMERQQQQKAAEKAARKAEKQAQKEQAKAEREQRRLERQQAFEENTEEGNSSPSLPSASLPAHTWIPSPPEQIQQP